MLVYDSKSGILRKLIDSILSGGVTSDALARPSIANVNNNDNEDQNVIISFSKTGTVTDGYISNVEYSKKWHQLGKRWTEVWTADIGYAVAAPPSLGNTYGDKELEIVVGLKNGSLIVLDSDGNQKWQYHALPKYSALKGDLEQMNLGFTAISDIDNDGKAEIISADYTDTIYYDLPGTLYVLEDNGASYTEEAVINISVDGGAKGAVAIANLDNDDNQEIVVPSYYGIRVYENFSGVEV